jgi:hypothetical protein
MVYGYKYKLTEIISPKTSFCPFISSQCFFPKPLMQHKVHEKESGEKKKKPEMIPKKGRGKPQR